MSGCVIYMEESSQGRTDGEVVRRVADDVLRRGLCDEAAAEQQDFLLRLARPERTPELWRHVLVLLEQRAAELGENERDAVDVLVVVAGRGDGAHGLAEVPAVGLGADEEADLARGVRRDRGEGVLGDGEEFADGRDELLDEREVEPEALGLGGDVSAGGERGVEELEVGLLEERLGGTDGVRRVGDDDVVGGGVLGEELEAVADVDGDAGVVEEGGHVGEELANS